MKHLFTFRQRPNESLTGKLARVSSDTLSQVSNKCRPTVGRLSTLFLLLALSFGFSSQAWAEDKVGVWTTDACGITLTINSSDQSKTYNSTGADTWALGKVTSLTFKKFWFKTWQKEGDSNLCSGKLYYRVYLTTTATPGDFKSKDGNGSNWDWIQGDWPKTRNPEFSKDDMNINLLSGLSNGNYTLEYYFEAKGDANGTSCNNSFYLNNTNGANYKVTFSVGPDCPNCKTLE